MKQQTTESSTKSLRLSEVVKVCNQVSELLKSDKFEHRLLAAAIIKTNPAFEWMLVFTSEAWLSQHEYLSGRCLTLKDRVRHTPRHWIWANADRPGLLILDI